MNTDKDIFLVPMASILFPFELPLRRNGFFLIHPASIDEFTDWTERMGKQFYVELKKKGIKPILLRNGYTKLSLINID